MSNSYAEDRPTTSNDSGQLAVKEAKKHSRPGVMPVIEDNKSGQTTPSQSEERVPRLPHEHDESADSQVGNVGVRPSAEQSLQAFEDVERGLVNTDRGLEGNTLVDNAPSSGKKKRDHPPI